MTVRDLKVYLHTIDDDTITVLCDYEGDLYEPKVKVTGIKDTCDIVTDFTYDHSETPQSWGLVIR